jgi:ribosomal protein L21E
MKYNIGDKVVIAYCPNAKFIGVTGTVVVARLGGTYNVEPDEKISGVLNTVFVYESELAPA